jgi:dephospho-CoA kinase
MVIIGITGTLGAGKGTIVAFLLQEYGFVHYSVRALVTEYIEKEGLVVNRDSMVEVANKLRKAHGPAILAEMLFNRALAGGKDCVIESIRTPGEVEALRRKGRFYLFAVDADPDIRYERIKSRNSETDRIPFNTFLENEAREMASTDPHHQNIRACIERADFIFENNHRMEDLHAQVGAVMEKILSKESR